MAKKLCRKCNLPLPRKLFKRDPRYSDGYAPWCIGCRREYDAARKRTQRRLNTPYAQRVRAVKRSRSQLDRRILLRRKPENRRKATIASQRHRDSNPLKVKARSAISRAIRAGRLVPPVVCQLCGKKPKPQIDGRRSIRADHYKGYSEQHWLDVQWICLACDGELERKRGNTTLGEERYDKEKQDT